MSTVEGADGIKKIFKQRRESEAKEKTRGQNQKNAKSKSRKRANDLFFMDFNIH